jgi:hypothetical protein
VTGKLRYGNVIKKTDPLAGWLETFMSPLCSLAMVRARLNPSPVPGLVLEDSARKNRSNIFSK